MDRPRTRKRTNKEREEEEYALTGALNGFREDVRRMLDAYLQTQSSRLVDFVDLWERVKFGHVFAGFRTKNNTKRLDFTELHQFAEKVFHEAVLLCLTPNNQQVRQAGFYFLYCLYIARPLHCHAKIRVHPKNELVPLKTFAKSLQTEGSPDPLMCFLELYRTHAFDYTLTSFPVGELKMHPICTVPPRYFGDYFRWVGIPSDRECGAMVRPFLLAHLEFFYFRLTLRSRQWRKRKLTTHRRRLTCLVPAPTRSIYSITQSSIRPARVFLSALLWKSSGVKRKQKS